MNLAGDLNDSPYGNGLLYAGWNQDQGVWNFTFCVVNNISLVTH